MGINIFDAATDLFEESVDWAKRLANEAPFYRRLFERIGARRVLDAACGTGRHAAMFHEWGLDVEGADLSPRMIESAGRRCGESASLRWVVRGYDAPIEAAAPFDAVVCVGNSLALAPDAATVERAVGEMLRAVRPGGALVLHVLNLFRLPDGPCTWPVHRRVERSEGTMLLLRGVHRSGREGYVELLAIDPETAAVRHESARLLGLEAADLEAAVRRAGATHTAIHGDYHESPYDRAGSVDLIVTAMK